MANSNKANPVMTFNSTFTLPEKTFNGYGYNSEYNTTLSSIKGEDISNQLSGVLNNIKTKNIKANITTRRELLKENPLFTKYYISEMDAGTKDASVENTQNNQSLEFENIFSPTSEVLFNMNKYRFIYNKELDIELGQTTSKSTDPANNAATKLTTIYGQTKVVPALFNPMYAIQVIGMTDNVPLLNGQQPFDKNTYEDTSDCSIKTLVNQTIKETQNPDGDIRLGKARYSYSDFMYCKDLGKMSNNYLITLRKFPLPVGDNIFRMNSKKYDNDDYPVTFNEAGDIGRLVTWFGTEDNKLEDILKYSFNASWKKLDAEIEPVPSQEEDSGRGIIGMAINTFSGKYTDSVAQGTGGAKSFYSLLDLTVPADDAAQRQYAQSDTYDRHKIYTPKNTIQSTHTYEGKLEFEHTFTLKFSYKLRAYDNINPKSAFLDLLGNILEVTYRRGQFWGGARRWAGPPQNTKAWERANEFIDKAWDKGTTFIGQLISGKADFGSLLGSIGGALKSFGDGAMNFLNRMVGGDFSGAAKDLVNKAAGIVTGGHDQANLSQVGNAVKGLLKNELGRPAVYALQSLLTGDNVGLWHVTIGNPFNPIVSIGNLIIDEKVTIEHSGPLGIDDFPTELTVTIPLKHARGRDITEIGRMYTQGIRGLYTPITPNMMGLTLKDPANTSNTNNNNDNNTINNGKSRNDWLLGASNQTDAKKAESVIAAGT